MESESLTPTSLPPGPPFAALFLQAAQGINIGAGTRSGSVDARGVSHADLAHLGRLIQCAQTVQRLKDSTWYAHLPPQFAVNLDPPSFASVLLRLYENASSGVLFARNRHGQSRTVAFAAGSAIATATDATAMKLGPFLVESGRLDQRQAEQAAQLMQVEEKPLGWAILQLGLLSVHALLQAQQAHAEHVLHDLLQWTHGEVTFFETSAAVDLHRIIDTPTLALLRQRYVHVHRQTHATLQAFTAPFFARLGPLKWRESNARLAPLTEGCMPQIVEYAKHGRTSKELHQAIGKLLPAQQSRALADIYSLTTYGFLGFDGEPFAIHLANLPIAFHGPGDAPATTDPMELFRQQQTRVAQAKRELGAFRPADALQTLREIIREVANEEEAPPEAVAYLAIALAITGDAHSAMQTATRNLQRRPQDALAHAAMSRALTAAGNVTQAPYHHKTALALSQKDPRWYAEIQSALAYATKASNRRPAQPRDGRAITLWIFTAAALAALFALAMVFRLGEQEYNYSPRDPFFYGRRLALLLLGGVSLCVWEGKSPSAVVRSMQWKSTKNWVQGALLYGTFIGLCSPMQRVTGAFGAVVGLTLLHVLCEEVFFRGFITRILSDQVQEERLAVLLSGIIYGLYHMTYYSFWVESGWQPRLYYMGLIAGFAGVPYAFMYLRSKTLTVPLLCHAAVSLAMMGKSFVIKLNYFGLHLP